MTQLSEPDHLVQDTGGDFEPRKEIPRLADRYIVLDGLDGSGKGTLAECLANTALEGYSIVVDYPQYELPWGKFLKHLLHENDEGLSIKDRMLVYALNRLETAMQLREHINQARQDNPDIKINLIFDRSPISNIITAAYYFKSIQNEWRLVPPEGDTYDYNISDPEKSFDVKQWILDLYDFMMKIDAEFMRISGVTDAMVFVPMIDEQVSMHSLHQDSSRSGADLYENESVQGFARLLYKIVAEAHPERLHLYDQGRDGGRMTPRQQAEYILGVIGLPLEQASTHQTDRYQFREELVDKGAVNALLERFGQEELKRHNPYKT